MLLLMFFLCSEVEFTKGPGKWRVDQYGIYTAPAIDLAESGEIALIDRDGKEMVILNPDGSLKKKVGGHGEGPGEFQSPVDVTWLESEKVFVVFDQVSKRFSKWTAQGDLVKEYKIQTNGLWPRLPSSERVFLSRFTGGQAGHNPRLESLDLRTGESTTLWTYELQQNSAVTDGLHGGNRITIIFSWDPDMSYDMGSNFLVANWGSDNGIDVLAFDGRKQRTLRPRLKTQPLFQKLVDEELERVPPQYLDMVKAQMHQPEHLPIVTQLRVDDADRIWVFESEHQETGKNGFVILSPTGEELGRGHIKSIPYQIKNQSVYLLESEKNNEDPDDRFMYLSQFRFSF